MTHQITEYIRTLDVGDLFVVRWDETRWCVYRLDDLEGDEGMPVLTDIANDKDGVDTDPETAEAHDHDWIPDAWAEPCVQDEDTLLMSVALTGELPCPSPK